MNGAKHLSALGAFGMREPNDWPASAEYVMTCDNDALDLAVVRHDRKRSPAKTIVIVRIP